MTDMERFIAAADALADAANNLSIAAEQFTLRDVRENPAEAYDFIETADEMLTVATREYRAAREAITRGTPPAFATSA